MIRFGVLGLVVAVALVALPASAEGNYKAAPTPLESAISGLKLAIQEEEGVRDHPFAPSVSLRLGHAVADLRAVERDLRSVNLVGTGAPVLADVIHAEDIDDRGTPSPDAISVAIGLKKQALAALEAVAGETTPASRGCTVTPGQSTIAANETAFTISGCKTPVAKLELKLNGAFVDRTPAGVEKGSSYHTADCGHGAGTDLVCTNVEAPVGATIIEGVAGLKSKEGFVAIISGATGAAQVIKGTLPEVHPLNFTGTVVKDATPNTYTFSVKIRGPWQRMWFALPRGAQVLYETEPRTGVSVGEQTQSDHTEWLAFLRIGVAHDASSYLGTYTSTVTFAGTTSLPATLKDGGDGVDALTSSTGHAAVR